MNQSKVHSSSTQGNVPFSWENQPGISKVKHNQEYYYCTNKELGHLIKLPLPPYLLDSSSTPASSPWQKQQHLQQQELQNIPLPPCPFQSLTTTTRSNSRKGGSALRSKQNDDPFLAAFKECTKSTTTVGQKMNKLCKSKKYRGNDDHHEENQSRFGMGFMFSCKNSCGVREGNFIRSHQVSAAAPIVRETSWRQQNEKTQAEFASHGDGKYDDVRRVKDCSRSRTRDICEYEGRPPVLQTQGEQSRVLTGTHKS